MHSGSASSGDSLALKIGWDAQSTLSLRARLLLLVGPQLVTVQAPPTNAHVSFLIRKVNLSVFWSKIQAGNYLRKRVNSSRDRTFSLTQQVWFGLIWCRVRE